MLNKVDVVIVNVLSLLCFLAVLAMQVMETQAYFGNIGALFQ